MQLTFWGTRGSIAKPGPDTVRYGGNTSCVEVRSASGTLVVLDCGTGAHGLGQSLLARGGRPLRGHILIGHTHWDHIQGFPFFAPLFVPGTEWDVYAPRGLVQHLRDTLADQMQYTFFPVALGDLKSTIRYHELVEGTFQLEDIRVSTRYLNHPALTLGYRLEADGASIVYATDHEPHGHASAMPAGPWSGHADHFPNREDQHHIEFLAGADLLVHDAQYTAEEYPAREGWGHSTVEYVVDAACAARVGRLALFHHDPGRSDAAVDRLVSVAAVRVRAAGATLGVFGAAEGETVRLEPRVPTVVRAGPDALVEAGEPLAGRSVVLAIADPVLRGALADAVRTEGLVPVGVGAVDEGLRLAKDADAALLVGDREGFGALDDLRDWRAGGGGDVPIVALATALPVDEAGDDVLTDWLIQPFSIPYFRTRLRAWLLRSRARWVRADLPDDEAHRLEGVQRFRRVTPDSFRRVLRLAERVFEAEFIGIGLIEEDRQIMYARDLVREVPRDVSMCAHAILQAEPLLVYPQDPRLGDSPLFTEQKFQSYLGARLQDEQGRSVGTLCIMDPKPRVYREEDLRLLSDLADMAGAELSRGV